MSDYKINIKRTNVQHDGHECELCGRQVKRENHIMVRNESLNDDGSQTITIIHLQDWEWDAYLEGVPEYRIIGPYCQKRIPATHKLTEKNLWTKPKNIA